MTNPVFYRNLPYMEDPKIIKEIGLNGQEITFIVDSRLNGVAERMKAPQKLIEANERLLKLERSIKEIRWS